MNALEQAMTQTTLEDLSREIMECVQQGDAEGLSGLIARVKALGPRNVYVVAVEKQVAKLSAPDTTPEQRGGLLKAFPVLMERAVAEARRIVTAPPRPDPNEERRDAMEKMKRQYFERADSFVDRGEFQRALEEVRRVLILDRTNALALEYEQKIKHLTEAAKPAAADQEQAAPVSNATPASAEEQPKSKLRLVVAIAVIVLLSGSAVWYFVLRGPAGQGAESATAQTGQVAGTIAAVPSSPDNSQSGGNTPTATPPVPATAGRVESNTASVPPPAPTNVAATTVKQSAGTTSSVSSSPSAASGPAKAGMGDLALMAQPQAQPAPAPAQELPPPPQPFVPVETSVEVVRIPALRYPEVAMRNKIEGRVVVEVTVSPNGKPAETKVLRSDNELLDDAAIEAAMNGTYKSATMNDSPVASKVSIPFDFRLKR